MRAADTCEAKRGPASVSASLSALNTTLAMVSGAALAVAGRRQGGARWNRGSDPLLQLLLPPATPTPPTAVRSPGRCQDLERSGWRRAWREQSYAVRILDLQRNEQAGSGAEFQSDVVYGSGKVRVSLTGVLRQVSGRSHSRQMKSQKRIFTGV